ncbi:zinc finger CCHC domain-containing protein 8 [Triplophysa rosa]|uniref:zinc finger CCHC domain-containing protein 8 n=1 Tax=Triplophysa rosa TaxID=992332 RepID=UPI002545C62F|nr:zinc finger CCHC domain-containing protein 8 [Triplophysa rosa]
MAEVDFGDTELFDQFEKAPVVKHIRFSDVDEEESDEVRDRLVACEATIERLNAENEELKRNLNILSRPTGIKIENSKTDGPLCQVLFGNNSISKQRRQEIEDFICCLVQKHLQEQKRNDPEGSALHVNPQYSSFVMEESYKVQDSCTSRQVKDAFSVVGSVLYFNNFCVDKLGQPLLNENPQLTEGWEIPKYQQVFGQVIALEGQEVQIKEKRPRPCCFNCCSEDHQLRDCPEPKDMARINEKRKEFSQNSSLGNQRYHAEEVEERFAKYKPGKVSQELLDALGITTNTLPPYIYRMRELGYPHGWLKEAEMENSGLTLYDGKESKDGDAPDDDNDQCKISYDVSKLVDFPGFNVMALPNVRDEYRSFGSIPMQPQHWKENYAACLTNTFPSPGSGNKRRHTTELILGQTKKLRSTSDQESDMEIESDHDSSTPMRSDGFQFQPPPPPGASSPSIPPPLPLGTPPSTPTPPPLPKDTPPASNSPSIPARGVAEGEESEDGLTLEELEEQQRLLWEALEKADTTTNSDSEAGASVTTVPSSPSVCTPLRPDAEDDSEKIPAESSSHTFEVLSTPTSPVVERGVSVVCEDERTDNEQVKRVSDENVTDVQEDMSDIIVLDEVYEESDSQDATNGTEHTPQVGTQERNAEEAENSEESVKVTVVPHRSKFAAGIIPFEDTPEFTEVAEATGVYLKIRDLLKGSPRNQAKNKK